MSSVEQLMQTSLHSWHASNGGRMVDFAGWSMPVQYKSIIDEHKATRSAIGMFDVSHMGRFFFTGTGVDTVLDRLTTRKVAGAGVGRIRYSLMCNEAGCILDDVLVYHLPAIDDSPFYMMVVNASNRDKISKWIESNRQEGDDWQLNDRTTETAMIACQGPKTNKLVAEISELDPDSLKYYTGATTKVCGHETIVSRTGYTGEDGCELIVDNAHAQEIWNEVHSRATKIGGMACGLASRDTLRLEAAMPLYGHELGEEINAAQTDLGFAMSFKNREFAGRSAILAAKKENTLPTRIGLQLEGKRAARENCDIIVGDEKVGVITSGTFSPTLEKSISMGYIDPKHAAVGTKVTIDIRGKSHDAEIVELPFYKRS